MSLQFIFGNSGSGKSSYLYRNILKEAAEHPEKNYLVLVPEQFTMQLLYFLEPGLIGLVNGTCAA